MTIDYSKPIFSEEQLSVLDELVQGRIEAIGSASALTVREQDRLAAFYTDIKTRLNQDHRLTETPPQYGGAPG